MSTLEISSPLALVRQKINDLNLDPVIKTAKDRFKDEWPPHYVYEVARQYRKFLNLLAASKADGRRLVPPTRDIHEFWKIHHEDMRLYYPDIIHATGRFIHCPAFVFRRKKDIRAVNELWRLHFGENPPVDPPKRDSRFLKLPFFGRP